MDGSYAPLSEEEVPGAVPQPLKHTPVGQGQATAAVRGVPPVHQVNSEQQQQQQQQAEHDALLHALETGDVPGWTQPASQPWAPDPFSMSLARRRDWSGGLFQCCGRGSTQEWQICCLSFFCLPVVFAQNMRRGLRLDYWRNGVLAVCCWGFNWGVQLLALSACGSVPVWTSEDSDEAVSASDLEFRREAYEASVQQYSHCMRGFQPVQVIMHLACWCFLLYAGLRRIQMRRRYGLPGDDMRDYISWLCCAPCSVAQETRTLLHNNVSDGVWRGRPGASEPQQATLLAPQQVAPPMFVPAGVGAPPGAYFPGGQPMPMPMMYVHPGNGQQLMAFAPGSGAMPVFLPQGMQLMQQQQEHANMMFLPPTPPPPPQAHVQQPSATAHAQHSDLL